MKLYKSFVLFHVFDDLLELVGSGGRLGCRCGMFEGRGCLGRGLLVFFGVSVIESVRDEVECNMG